jgi:hypothetical protein
MDASYLNPANWHIFVRGIIVVGGIFFAGSCASDLATEREKVEKAAPKKPVQTLDDAIAEAEALQKRLEKLKAQAK